MKLCHRSCLAFAGLLIISATGCYQPQPVDLKIRPITGPSSSVGGPIKRPPATTEEKEAEPKNAEQAKPVEATPPIAPSTSESTK